MTVYDVEEERWAIKLAPQLTGRAQQAYAAMSTETAGNYKEVKKAILCCYDIGEETYQQRFGSVRKEESEAYVELVTRLQKLAKRWLAGCDSVAAVIEKLVVEQLLDILPAELQIWLCERKPATGNEAATLADDYMLAQWRKRLHCKNLRVVLTLLWVISVACSGASILPSIVSAAIWTWPQNFLLFIRTDDGSFTVAT